MCRVAGFIILYHLILVTLSAWGTLKFSKWLLVRQLARTKSGRRRLGSVTLARSRVWVRAGYEFISCRHHLDQRVPAGPIATA